MALTWKHRGETFTADTPEDLIKLRTLIRKEEQEAERRRAELRFFARLGGPAAMSDQLEYAISEEQHSMAEEAAKEWTLEKFVGFIDRLGVPQQSALAQLVTRRRMTDDELRKALNVSGNQALAGILSGISKQAAALGIPARSIFSFENLRSGGKRRSIYAVADTFLQVATEMNWPPPKK